MNPRITVLSPHKKAASMRGLIGIFTLPFPSDPSKSAKSKEPLLGPKIKHTAYKDLKHDGVQPLPHRLSSVRIIVRRWNLIPEELILQSDSGKQYELLYYQSLFLALIEWDQKQLLYSDRSFGFFLHFL